jgi:predicted Zn-dependent peptidase
LENGVKVASELSSNSNIASLTVVVNAGTRSETLETSGVN